MSAAPHRKTTDRKGSSRVPGSGRNANPRSAVRNPQFLWVALAVAVLAGIPFALGKYFELKSPDPFDSGCYVYSAQHVLSGARIGYDEKPSAQAGTLLMN